MFSSRYPIRVVLAVSLLALPAVQAVAEEPESCEFRIVNWNVSGEDHNEGNDIAVAQAVDGYVQEIDANVVLLQEVTEPSLTHLEGLLPGWRCRWARFGVDYIAACTDGEPTDFLARDLSPDTKKGDTDPPPEDPWWGWVQVEYRGFRFTSVHTRSFWRDHQRAELHAEVTSGVIGGDFNHIDPEVGDPEWFQTDLAEEWTWEGDYRGDEGQWKIDHILSIDEPQHVAGDARDKEGSNHRVVLGEVGFRGGPVLEAAVTNAAQPVEVDGSCGATVEFRLTIHDSCCLDPEALGLDVTASNPTANATLGEVLIDSVAALGPRDVEVIGHIGVSALESCPAEVVIEATATDCAGNPGQATTSVEVIDTTPPQVTAGNDDLECLWPPNHEYVCFSADAFDPTITDNCSASSAWAFHACDSDQPENAVGNGDGDTTEDCVIDTDAQGFCARSERAGKIVEGRRYGLGIGATDSCGNLSGTTQIGRIHVPHDEDPGQTCVSPPAP